MQPRTVPNPGDGSAYINYHRDEGDEHGCWDHAELCHNIKLIVAVGHQPHGGGNSTVIPGSHRLRERPGLGGWDTPGAEAEALRREFVGSAGDAVLFDTRTWCVCSQPFCLLLCFVLSLCDSCLRVDPDTRQFVHVAFCN